MGPFHLRSIYVRLERQEEFPRIRHHLLHALPAAILHAALLVHLERQKKGGVFWPRWNAASQNESNESKLYV